MSVLRVIVKAETQGGSIRTYTQGVSRDAETMQRKTTQAFRNAADDTARSTRRMSSDMVKLSSGIGRSLDSTTSRLASFRSLMVVTFGTAVTGQAIRFGGTFQQSMANVQAVTGATGAEFDALTQKAAELGKTTVSTAAETAAAMEALGKAGIDTNATLGAINETLLLAQAGELAMAEAAEVAATAIKTFQIPLDDLDDTIDTIVHTATSSNQTVRDMANAFRFVGGVASATKTPINEVSAGLALLANRGIRGEQAGTGLRRALSVLIGDLEEGEAGIGDLNVKVTDSTGEFVGLVGAMESLDKALEGVGTETEKASIIMQAFGQRAGPAVINILDSGVDALQEFAVEAKNAQGTAQQIADIKLDTFFGDLKLLTSAVGELNRKIFEDLSPTLRSLAQDATRFVNSIDVDEVRRALRVITIAAETAAAAVSLLFARRLIAGIASLGVAIRALNVPLTSVATTATATAATTKTALTGIGFTAKLTTAQVAGVATAAGTATTALTAMGAVNLATLVAAVGALSFQLTRAALEATGLNEVIQESFANALESTGDVEARFRSIVNEFDRLSRFNVDGVKLAPEVVIPDNLRPRFEQLVNDIEGNLRVAARVTALDPIEDRAVAAAAKRTAQELQAALESEFVPVIDAANRRQHELTAQARRFAEEVPEAWARAAEEGRTLRDVVAEINDQLAKRTGVSVATGGDSPTAPAGFTKEEEQARFDLFQKDLEIRIAHNQRVHEEQLALLAEEEQVRFDQFQKALEIGISHNQRIHEERIANEEELAELRREQAEAQAELQHQLQEDILTLGISTIGRLATTMITDAKSIGEAGQQVLNALIGEGIQLLTRWAQAQLTTQNLAVAGTQAQASAELSKNVSAAGTAAFAATAAEPITGPERAPAAALKAIALTAAVGAVGGAIGAALASKLTGTVALAEGGVVTRATSAIVGEEGPEVVLPLASSRADRFFQQFADRFASRNPSRSAEGARDAVRTTNQFNLTVPMDSPPATRRAERRFERSVERIFERMIREGAFA